MKSPTKSDENFLSIPSRVRWLFATLVVVLFSAVPKLIVVDRPGPWIAWGSILLFATYLSVRAFRAGIEVRNGWLRYRGVWGEQQIAIDGSTGVKISRSIAGAPVLLLFEGGPRKKQYIGLKIAQSAYSAVEKFVFAHVKDRGALNSDDFRGAEVVKLRPDRYLVAAVIAVPVIQAVFT